MGARFGGETTGIESNVFCMDGARIGFGTGVGASGPIPALPAAPNSADSQGWANMEKAAMAMVEPRNLPPPNLPMARPVGPGQLPPTASMPTFGMPVGPGPTPQQQEFINRLKMSAFDMLRGYGF